MPTVGLTQIQLFLKHVVFNRHRKLSMLPRDSFRHFLKLAIVYLLFFILNSIKYVHHQLTSKVYRIFPEEEEILLLPFTLFKVTSIEKHTTDTDQQYEIPPTQN